MFVTGLHVSLVLLCKIFLLVPKCLTGILIKVHCNREGTEALKHNPD